MATEQRMLIVVDDETLLGVLNEQLQLHENFLTTTARTAKEGLERAKIDYFSVIILDVTLPDMGGYEVCRLMRQNSVTSNILMLTEANSEADLTSGLNVGATDCIAKPFRLGVLLARLRAYTTRQNLSDDMVFTIGPYSFQPSKKFLVRDTDQCKLYLTDKETEVLRYLYKSGNKIVSREVLLDEVWGYNANVTTHTLETHVYRLRQKIEPDPSNVTILITEPGGYRLEL